MKKLFIGLLLMFMLAPVYASQDSIPGWTKLTAEQKAQFNLDVAKKAAEKAAVPVKAQDLEEWVNLGKSIGVGFASTAEELGMGVDKLMNTTTGKIAMFLIVWNYVGDQFIGIVGGILWFMIMLPAWMYYFKRWVLVPTYTYHENGKRKSLTYEKNRSTDSVAYFSVVLLIILGAGLILIF